LAVSCVKVIAPNGLLAVLVADAAETLPALSRTYTRTSREPPSLNPTVVGLALASVHLQQTSLNFGAAGAALMEFCSKTHQPATSASSACETAIAATCVSLTVIESMVGAAGATVSICTFTIAGCVLILRF